MVVFAGRLLVWFLLVVLPSATADAHQSGCHRWHSCPSDRGTYVCGDLGYCSQCPDNEHCQSGEPQPRLDTVPPPLETQPRFPNGQAPPVPDAVPPHTILAQVIQVVDGDTVDVWIDGRVERVRYIGVDTPEIHHPEQGEEPGGREAADINRRLVERKTVRVEFDVQERDQNGRFLAYVHVGDMMVNAELVRQGYAQVMTIPPNVKHQELFLRLQRQAREAGRGLWRR